MTTEQQPNELEKLYHDFCISARKTGVHYTDLAWREFVYFYYELGYTRNPETEQPVWTDWKKQFPELQKSISSFLVSSFLETYLHSYALQCEEQWNKEIRGEVEPEGPLLVLHSARLNIIRSSIYAITKCVNDEVRAELNKIPSPLDQVIEPYVAILEKVKEEPYQNSPFYPSRFKESVDRCTQLSMEKKDTERHWNDLHNHLDYYTGFRGYLAGMEATFYHYLQKIDLVTIRKWELSRPRLGLLSYINEKLNPRNIDPPTTEPPL